MLHKFQKFSFIALLEPFQHRRTINKYKNRIQMSLVLHNYLGKIWFFVNHGFIVNIITDTEQQIS